MTVNSRSPWGPSLSKKHGRPRLSVPVLNVMEEGKVGTVGDEPWLPLCFLFFLVRRSLQWGDCASAKVRERCKFVLTSNCSAAAEILARSSPELLCACSRGTTCQNDQDQKIHVHVVDHM